MPKAMRWKNRLASQRTICAVAIIGTLIWCDVECRIMEKIQTVCNGPCGRLTSLCPKGHRVAIRDAVYRVQEKNQNCTAFPACNDPGQDVCCDPTPNDCVFPFSPTHLKALLRNCSGNADCLIQTERSEVETVACSATDPSNLSSQTALNYVCVNDNLIANVCSKKETVVRGKTLFAMLNPRGMRKPPKGSVCTCLAESTQWPTTNSIAVFLVDMRLNTLMSRDCAGANLSVRSGNNIKQLDCESSRDARVNFPFVAVLNDSNVATLTLEISNNMPEFLWFGFEANEEEDIRLSCKLQGFLSNRETSTPSTGIGESPDRRVTQPSNGEGGASIPKGSTDEDSKKDESKGVQRRSKGGKASIGGLVGGIVAGIIIILVVVAVVAFLTLRWRQKRRESNSGDLTDPDMEVYYSTTNDEIQNLASKNAAQMEQDVYTCPDKGDVKIRKKASSKKVRIVSTPEFLENNGEDYVSALEVRERKRQSEKKDLDSFNTYDHLGQGDDRLDDLVLDGYDQLHPPEDKPPSYSSISGQGRGDHPHDGRDSVFGLDLGQVNQAYEVTSVVGTDVDDGGMEQPGVYFELEKRVQDGESYEEHFFVKNRNVSPDSTVDDEKRDLDIDSTSASSHLQFPVASPQLSPTYTDAVSTRISVNVADKKNAAKSLTEADKKRRQSMPVAAPRRNIPKDSSRCSHYDIAKPIQ